MDALHPVRRLRPSGNTAPRRGVRIARASGSRFWDDQGREYIDISSQTVNVLMGQVHPQSLAAAEAALERLTFVDQDFDCDIYDRAYERLAAVVPGHLKVVNLRMNDGSSAVECAVKQARRHRGRPTVLTIKGIYLGQNAQSIHFRGLGEPRRDHLIGSSESVIFAPLPRPRHDLDFDHASDENGAALEALIRRHHDELACVLIDPVMISSGVFGGRDMAALCARARSACDAHGVPLVFDECQSFGWVPGNTLSARWNIPSDMMCLAKGMAGGLPLAACLSTDAFDNLEFGDADYTTGGGVASVAAMAAICETLADRADAARFEALVEHFTSRLEDEVARRGPHLRTRGVGLIRCVELISPETAARAASLVRSAAALAMREGLYVRTYGGAFGLKPNRMATPDDLDAALDKLFFCIDAVLAAPASSLESVEDGAFSY
jgi:4-aminobutyrate aminotransferase-like enzyme